VGTTVGALWRQRARLSKWHPNLDPGDFSYFCLDSLIAAPPLAAGCWAVPVFLSFNQGIVRVCY
jgi:hypothetical protein